MTKEKKPPVQKKTPSKKQPAKKRGNQISAPTQPPILRPVPDKGKVGPLSFCRGIEKGHLTVIIQNEGGDIPADTEAKVEVNFPNKGSQEQVLLPLLSSQQSEPLEFKLPKNAFDPDCEFDINIYIGENLHRTTGGICAGEIHCSQ